MAVPETGRVAAVKSVAVSLGRVVVVVLAVVVVVVVDGLASRSYLGITPGLTLTLTLTWG